MLNIILFLNGTRNISQAYSSTKKGYLSYYLQHNFGNISPYNESSLLQPEAISNFISKLEHNKTYSVLFYLKFYLPDTNRYEHLTITKCLKITKNVNIKALDTRINFEVQSIFNRYSIDKDDYSIQLLANYKE